MNDKYHLSNEQGSYGYHSINNPPTTQSPNTVSTSSSPMTSLANTTYVSATMFDPIISQYSHDYSQQYQQQNSWPLFHHSQQQRPTDYNSRSYNNTAIHGTIMSPQLSLSSRPGQPYPQQQYSSLGNVPSYLQQQQNQHQHSISPYQRNLSYISVDQRESSSFKSPSPPPRSATPIVDWQHNSYNNNSQSPLEETLFNDDDNYLKQYQSQRPTPYTHSKRKYKTTTEAATTSPKFTPLPSPVISKIDQPKGNFSVFNSKPLKRQQSQSHEQEQKHHTEKSTSHKSTTLEQHSSLQREDSSTSNSKEQNVMIQRQLSSNNRSQSVDQLENELAFLRDGCATISIMLDSLRNAFLADDLLSSTNKQRSPCLTSAISFFQENSSNMALNTIDKRCRSKTLVQNPEMEREMRTAYDDLMLQVRQLEKKAERLECKIKDICQARIRKDMSTSIVINNTIQQQKNKRQREEIDSNKLEGSRKSETLVNIKKRKTEFSELHSNTHTTASIQQKKRIYRKKI